MGLTQAMTRFPADRLTGENEGDGDTSVIAQEIDYTQIPNKTKVRTISIQLFYFAFVPYS